VGCEQVASARQQGHLQLVDPSHRANLHGFGVVAGIVAEGCCGYPPALPKS
jgi:hypothetical protein